MWHLSRRLMFTSAIPAATPPLQASDGSWCTSSKAKADLISATPTEKFKVPALLENEYTGIDPTSSSGQSGFLAIRRRVLRKILRALRVDNAMGPDMISSRLLRMYADTLALPRVPISIICRRIISTGVWPSCWMVHWICPIFKKVEVYRRPTQ
jgi:hypothetical protein